MSRASAAPRRVPCPACGARESRPRFTADDWELDLPGPFFAAECAGCGLLFQTPRIAPEDLPRHYPDDYLPYLARETIPPPALLRHLKRNLGYAHLGDPPRSLLPFGDRRGTTLAERLLLPRFVPGGLLLEIGCASGARLALLRDLGWTDCSGIEFSESAAARARGRGFPVRTGAVEDAIEGIPDAGLDAVIAGFVMEHLEDPFAVARRIAAKLKPEGQFLFSTLAIGSPEFRIYGRHWYPLGMPRHMTFFRKGDVARMLEGGFRVERMTHLAAPQDWYRSARYRLARGESGAALPFDWLMARAGGRLRPLCTLLARLGLTSRIAVRSRKA